MTTNPYVFTSIIGNADAELSLPVDIREVWNKDSVKLMVDIGGEFALNIYMDERGCPMLHFVSQAEDRYVCLD